MARSPQRFEGGFSVAGPRTTPGRSTNRSTMHPSTTAFDRQRAPFPGPPRWPGPPGLVSDGSANRSFAAPGVSAHGDAASAFNMHPGGMGSRPYQYTGVDPFTGAPAFMGGATGPAPREEPNTQGGRASAFNSMLNRLGAMSTAEPRVEDVTGVEEDFEGVVGDMV